jgi:phage terminase large subunit GpA-like protein
VLMISMGCDVGADGIWYHVKGWGRDRQSWSLEHGFLDGEVGTAHGEAWRALDALRRKTWRDSNGVDRPIEAVAVDANYITEVVTEWCKTRLGCHAVRGEEGWKVPAWLGRTSLRQFSERGRGRRRGTKTYPVGTWSLKARFYGELAVKKAPEDLTFPPAFCHFNQDWSEDDFEQLLSEVFVRQRDRKTGRERQGWHVIGKANHLLDCSIYAESMAEKLGLSTKSPAEWEWLERRWARLTVEQRSLFDAPELPDAPPAPAMPVSPETPGWRPPPLVIDL